MTEKINTILGVDDIFKAPAQLLEILLNKDMREKIFLQFLELFNYKLDFDYFHVYFQSEAAQRQKYGQDFTPMSVSGLLAGLTENKGEQGGMRFDSTAGTGGLLIAKWNQDRLQHSPLSIKRGMSVYKPSMYLYFAEELSDRAFPFLIFNMAIRGMNGAAIHCDSLSRECYGVFLIQNDNDNPIGFSSVNVMPYSKQSAQHFNVKFIEKKYPAHIESLPHYYMNKEEYASAFS